MTELANQQTAHKQRLARIAQAGARYRGTKQIAALENPQASSRPASTPVPAPQAVLRRREYFSKDRPSAYVPIARRILRTVAAEFEMTIDEMLASNQHPKFCLPRFVAIGLMMDMTKLSMPQIGRQLGGRDHTTILHGGRRLETFMASEAFRNRFDQMKAEIAA